jgi:hypothetical protein
MNKYFLLEVLFALVIVEVASGQIAFSVLPQNTIQTRLDRYEGNDVSREKALVQLFSEAGCGGANLSEQAVPGRKEPNVICLLPGETDKMIVVGAHFDHVPEGKGIVDNWSGAALLPSLYESLKSKPRKHSYLFVGFTGEEEGLVGSKFYVKHLPADERSRIQMAIILDTLGLGPTEIWLSRSNKYGSDLLGLAANVLHLPLSGMNVDGFGVSDEESFIDKKIPSITVHSITSQTTKVLHSRLDAPSAISFSDYYDTYHLLAGYLAILDGKLEVGDGRSSTP